jgi:type IV pilus assembly protein PilX
MSRAIPLNVTRQRGLVLVTALLLLVVVTCLAVGLFRSYGTDEKIAGNTREKQRALHAAEMAEQAAESWLAGNNALGTVTCTATVTYPAGQVCANTLANPALLPWQNAGADVGVNMAPTGMTNPMVITSTPGAGTYAQSPRYYIYFLGNRSSVGVLGSLTTSYYQIDAVGYGANAETAAVVETTFTTSAKASLLSGP